jgi:Rab-GTPase-TBC domain
MAAMMMTNTGLIRQPGVPGLGGLGQSSSVSQQLRLDDIKPYLYCLKDYWALKNTVQTKLAISGSGDLKQQIKKVIEKNGLEEKLRSYINNSIYNFKTDHNLVDSELRVRFGDACKKWKEHLATLLSNYYGEAALEIKKQKKNKETQNQPLPLKIYDMEDLLRFFSKFRPKEEDKLVRLQLAYFQVPPLKTMQAMFKELNIEEFEHIGEDPILEGHEEDKAEMEEHLDEKEKECLQIAAEEKSQFEFMSSFKSGIPPAARYKFMHAYAALDGASPKQYSQETLAESEQDVMRFFFKNDSLFCCNETSFFNFDESLLEYAHKLLSEKEILIDANESPEDSEMFEKIRMPCRVIPCTGFLNHLGLLTYFNKKKEKVYTIIKYLVKNHVAKLYDIRPTNSENIVALGIIFERLFLRTMNPLYINLRNLDIYPVDLAICWMNNFFVGTFSADQAFQLLDRLIGYNTLHLLPVVALSIYKYNEKALMEIKNKTEYLEVFQRLKELNWLHALNQYLFK